MVSAAIGKTNAFESVPDEDFMARRLAAGDSKLLADALTGTGRAFGKDTSRYAPPMPPACSGTHRVRSRK